MAATASFGPDSLPDTLSHTSRMNSQFSDVRFSSVAFARGTGQSHVCNGHRGRLTNRIVEDVLLGAEHGDVGASIIVFAGLEMGVYARRKQC
jgi:hypothetical protein